MKKNSILFVGTLLTSWLLYKQALGINALLFTIIIHLIVLSQFKVLHKRLDIGIFAFATIISAASIFLTGSSLSIGVWIASLLIFIGSIRGFKNSTYVRFINGLYVSSLGYFHQRLDKKPSQKEVSLHITEKEKHTGFIIFTIVITIIVVALFSYLYAQANELFAYWLENIDISFISFDWIIFIAISFYVLKNITSIAELDILTRPERSQETTLAPSQNESKLENERYLILGSILLTALCILISIFLIADFYSITSFSNANGTQLSQAIHKGVYALIVSIVLAISILLILFNGNFNFYKKNKPLKHLSLLWIFLNIILVLFTAYKTYQYCVNFGLTYKRIGVAIYLLLCISGLVTAYVKIFRLKKVVFLFQTNMAVLFFMLLILSTFNWSRLVTSFNLFHIENPDINYLLSLDKSNSDLLEAYGKDHPSLNQAPIITTRFDKEQRKLKNRSWKELTLQNFK